MIPIFTISIYVLIFISLLIILEREAKILSVITIIPFVFTCGVLDTKIQEYKLYPVDYTFVKTPIKNICITDYGTFESDKLIDSENWSKNAQGYIIKGYDYFGNEDYQEFTTTPYAKGIEYVNENNK